MKTLQTFLIIIILSLSVNLFAQKSESSNYSMQMSGFSSTGVSPSESVGSSNYLLQESHSEAYSCPITSGNQYILSPGMILPEGTPPAYCTENLYGTGCTAGDNINNFILGEISNLNSGCSDDGYGEFTDLSTNLTIGESYQLTLQTEYYNQYTSMWIDMNDNFAFEASEIILSNYVLSQSDSNYTIEINIPADAGLGEHRLRIRTNWMADSDNPCAFYNYGEAEDYTVNIVGQVQMGALAGFVRNEENQNPIDGAQIILPGSDFETFSDINGWYEFYLIPEGSYTINVLADGFEAFTSPEIDILPGGATSFNINLTPIEGYCTWNLYTDGCDYGDGFSDFSLGDIENPDSGCSPEGYGDFTDLSTNLSSGETYQFEVSSEYQNQKMSIWIDFNNNFIFEAEELLVFDFSLPVANELYIGNLEIPVDAQAGAHRMRIRSNFNQSCADPCIQYQWGEVEDYTVIIEETQVLQQSIQLMAGWNGVSSYLNPQNPNIESIFEPINNHLIIAQNSGGVYWPAQGINTLNNWNPSTGYEVKLSEDQVLDLTGTMISPAMVDVSEGWNLIPVLSPCGASPDELCAEIQDDVLLIKDVAGTGVYWPEFNINTLEMLQAGKSYYAYFYNQTVLNYSACNNGDELKTGVILSKSDSWKPANSSPYTHTIALDPSIYNKEFDGKWLGAFTNKGKCAGAIKINEDSKVLMLFGDDPLTDQKEGFSVGEPITFRISTNTNQPGIEVKGVYNDDQRFTDGHFKNHGISVLKNLDTNPANIRSPVDFSANIYPNPVRDILFVKCELPVLQVKILNLTGKVVLQQKFQQQLNFKLDIQHLPAGIYSMVMVGKRGVTTKKIIKTN